MGKEYILVFSKIEKKVLMKYFWYRVKKYGYINRERMIIKMNENNELLTYIYQNAKMGENSCTNLIKSLNGKDNKIKKVVEEELKGYEEFVKKALKLLKKHKIEEPKEKGVIADFMSKMGINMELMKDNSDARVADMLTKGFTMGNVDIQKKIDRFEKEVDKDILKLAKDLLEFGKKEIEVLKEYL